MQTSTFISRFLGFLKFIFKVSSEKIFPKREILHRLQMLHNFTDFMPDMTINFEKTMLITVPFDLNTFIM